MTEISKASSFWKSKAEDQDHFLHYPDGCKAPLPRTGVDPGRMT